MSKVNSKKDSKYKQVTDKLIKLIESETLPWRKDWNSGNGYQNPISQSVYQGINPLLCAIDCLTYDYQSPYFVSFNQAQEKGWKILKGSKATAITWAASIVKEKQNEQGEVEKDCAECTSLATGNALPVGRGYVSIKWFNVFNLDCIDDSESKTKISDVIAKLPSNTFSNSDKRDRSLDRFVDSQRAAITHQGNQPYYSPVKDKIVMPQFSDFSSKDAYYSTLLHELAHWTGHQSRLDRFKSDCSNSRKSKEYAFEELIAELSSAFTGSYLGLSEILLENHASYLNSWLSILKSDEQAFFKAARLAQKASDYLIHAKDS